MAYLQGYQQPNVITLAPDAVIFINGRNSLGSCNNCNKKFKIDNFTNISITLSVDGVPGGASFSLTAPRHQKDRIIQFDQPIIKPMFEVEIFMKGRFKDKDTGDPSFYPVFWGVVSNTSYSFSGGFHTLDINCKDILRFWELTKVNLQPGTGHTQYTGLSTSVKGSIFHDMNPYEIIYSLNYLVTAGAIVPANTFTAASPETIRKFKDTRNDLMDHWKEVFATTRDGNPNVTKTLRMVGFNGEVFFDQRVINRQKEKEQVDSTPSKGLKKEKAVYTKGIPKPQADFDSSFIGNFHPLLNLQGSFSTYESEIQSRLEIALQIKNRSGFEFFMDTTGDIIFKPPFYNMDVRDNPFYVIEGSDIISISFDEDESAVEATRVDVSGKFKQGYDYGNDVRPLGTFLDHNLARKFGLRDADTVADFLSTKDSCFVYAADYIEKINNYIAGSVTIPLRPELRMGFPVYLKPYDTFAYVKGVSHTFSMGGPSTTTLTLEKFRRKYIAQEGDQLLGTSIDSKGNFEGTPNRAIFLTKTPTKTSETIAKNQAKDEAISKANQSSFKSSRKKSNITTEGQTPEEKGVLDFSQFIASNLASETREITGLPFDSENYLKNLESELPVSDENGYELIGVFPYGRNIKLTEKSNGAIELVPKSNDSFVRAVIENSANLFNIDVQDKQKQKKGSSAIGSGIRAIERFDLGGASFKLSEIDVQSSEGSGQTCVCQQRKLERILQAVRFRRG